MPKISIRLTDEEAALLEAQAKENFRSINEQVRFLIDLGQRDGKLAAEWRQNAAKVEAERRQIDGNPAAERRQVALESEPASEPPSHVTRAPDSSTSAKALVSSQATPEVQVASPRVQGSSSSRIDPRDNRAYLAALDGYEPSDDERAWLTAAIGTDPREVSKISFQMREMVLGWVGLPGSERARGIAASRAEGAAYPLGFALNHVKKFAAPPRLLEAPPKPEPTFEDWLRKEVFDARRCSTALGPLDLRDQAIQVAERLQVYLIGKGCYDGTKLWEKAQQAGDPEVFAARALMIYGPALARREEIRRNAG